MKISTLKKKLDLYGRCLDCDNFILLKDQLLYSIDFIGCKKKSRKAVEFAFNGRITSYSPVVIPKHCTDFIPYKNEF